MKITDFLKARKKTIKLGVNFEKYLHNFFDFLYEGEIKQLDVREEADFEKFCALITFGDMYQVKTLLDYLLDALTDNPSKKDIFKRLKIMLIFKRIPRFKDEAERMIAWANEEMNSTEFLELFNQIAFASRS